LGEKMKKKKREREKQPQGFSPRTGYALLAVPCGIFAAVNCN
jgi:hypothetical protein